jgi:hypothetical protein
MWEKVKTKNEARQTALKTYCGRRRTAVMSNLQYNQFPTYAVYIRFQISNLPFFPFSIIYQRKAALGIGSYDTINMENSPCNNKQKNILSREKKNNFREKSLDFGLVRMASLKSFLAAQKFASKRPAFRNKPPRILPQTFYYSTKIRRISPHALLLRATWRHAF